MTEGTAVEVAQVHSYLKVVQVKRGGYAQLTVLMQGSGQGPALPAPVLTRVRRSQPPACFSLDETPRVSRRSRSPDMDPPPPRAKRPATAATAGAGRNPHRGQD